MNKMIIAYVSDEPYKQYLLKSMASVRRYNKNVEFAVLSKKGFEVPGAKVYEINPDTTKFKYRPNDRMGEGVYYKLWLPELPYDKVLFLDTDMICQRPLTELWKQPCRYICATESHIRGKKQAQQLGLKKYALTSMLLMNLKALRKLNFTQRCLDRLERETPDQHDETIINLEFGDKIRYLDIKYNYCRNRIYEHPIPESEAYLLHYIGPQQKQDMLLRNDFHSLAPIKGLIKGKTVAIVGNSSALLHKNQASEIDAHDVVIRFNKGFPSEKVGYKTTLLFLACTLSVPEIRRFGAKYTIKRSKLCQNICDFKVAPSDRMAIKQGTKQPSTGFIAINFALSCEPKQIDLYGFDSFKNPTYYNPIGYQTMHDGQKEAEKIQEYEQNGLLTNHL